MVVADTLSHFDVLDIDHLDYSVLKTQECVRSHG